MDQHSQNRSGQASSSKIELLMYTAKKRIAFDEQYITKDDIVEVTISKGKKGLPPELRKAPSHFFRIVCVASRQNDGAIMLLGQLLVHPEEESQHLHQTPIFLPFPVKDVQCKLEELLWNKIKEHTFVPTGMETETFDADHHIKTFLNTPRPPPQRNKRKKPPSEQPTENHTNEHNQSDKRKSICKDSPLLATNKTHKMPPSVSSSSTSQSLQEINNTNTSNNNNSTIAEEDNSDSSFPASEYSDLDPSVFNIAELLSDDDWVDKLLQHRDHDQQSNNTNQKTQSKNKTENNSNPTANSPSQITPTSPISPPQNVSSDQEEEDIVDVTDEEPPRTEPLKEPTVDPVALFKRIAANLEQIKHLDWQTFHANDINIGETYKMMGLLKVAKSRLQTQLNNVFAENYQHDE